MRYLLLLALPLVFACRRQARPVPASTANPTDYLLLRESWIAVDSSGWSYVYTYDSTTHLVTEARMVFWSKGSNPIDYDSVSYFFTYGQGHVVRADYTGNGQGYATYQYGANGRLSRVVTVNGTGDTLGTETNVVDGSGRVILAEDTAQGVITENRYVYDNLGDMTSVIAGDSTSATQFSAYDDGVNYALAINGLPEQCYNYGYWDVYSSTEPHNPRVLSNFGPDNSGVATSLTLYSQINYTYTYNDAGLPLSRDGGTHHVVFDYVKYR